MSRCLSVFLCLGLFGCSSGLVPEPVTPPRSTEPAADVDPFADEEEAADEEESDELPPRERPDDDEEEDEDPVDGTDTSEAEDVDESETSTDVTDPVTSCGAPGATIFDVVIEEAVLLPYSEPGVPWDWDGNVPDWLVDGSWWLSDELAESNVSSGWVTAADWAATLLTLTDEWADALLSGTVPPDPYLELYAHDGDDVTWEFGITETDDDTLYGIYFEEFLDVYLLEGELLYVMAHDEDLMFDDFVNGWALSEQDLQDWADCGSLLLTSGDANDPLQALYIEIRSVQ